MKPLLPKNPFNYIAFWQLMTFVMLILMIWAIEYWSLVSLLFGTGADHPNVYRGCLLTAAIFATSIVVIGNTYLQEKRVMRTLIAICSHCSKVKVNETEWQRIDAYISDQSLLSFTHGVCPDCMNDVRREIATTKDGSAAAK